MLLIRSVDELLLALKRREVMFRSLLKWFLCSSALSSPSQGLCLMTKQWSGSQIVTSIVQRSKKMQSPPLGWQPAPCFSCTACAELSAGCCSAELTAWSWTWFCWRGAALSLSTAAVGSAGEGLSFHSSSRFPGKQRISATGALLSPRMLLGASGCRRCCALQGLSRAACSES